MGCEESKPRDSLLHGGGDEEGGKKERSSANWKVKEAANIGERGETYEKETGIERSVCVQINGDVFERVKWRAGSFGVFSLA